MAAATGGLLEAVVVLGALAGWQEGQQDLADSGLVSSASTQGYHAMTVSSNSSLPDRPT